MTERIQIPIKRREKQQALYGPIVNDLEFESLKEFAVSEGLARNVTYGGFCTVDCALTHPALPELFSRLKNFGWLPYPGYVPIELRDSHFSIRIIRNWDPRDLDAAPLLRMSDWGEFEGSMGFKDRRGERWVAWSSGIGERLRGWDEPCRYVDGHNNFFAHQSVVDCFKQKALVGICFFPIIWADPENAKGTYWEISSMYSMPDCLIPVVQKDGLVDYEEGPFDPPELTWRTTDVERMVPFDVAWTKEIIGRDIPNYGRHYLIVSQRFRSACQDLSLPVRFEPVRLVDDHWVAPSPWDALPFLTT